MAYGGSIPCKRWPFEKHPMRPGTFIKQHIFFGSLLIVGSAVANDQDLFMPRCLNGHANHYEAKICPTLAPWMAESIKAAYSNWAERNRTVLDELKVACEDWIQRSYSGNEERIRMAKEKIVRWEEKQISEMRSNRSAMVNRCSGYLKLLTSDKSNIPPELPRAIEKFPAREPVFHD